MPFRWVKASSKSFSFLSVFFCLLLSESQAGTLFVQPSNGGSLSPASPGGGTFYYFGQIPGGPALPTYGTDRAFTLFTPLNPLFTQSTDPSLSQLLQLNVWSQASLSVSGAQVPVIVFYPDPGGDLSHPAPIAAVNGVRCDGTNSNCLAYNQVTANGYYYAARYPGNGQTVTLGIYLSDICRDAFTSGNSPSGCTSAAFTTPQVGLPSALRVSFSLGISPDGVVLPTSPVDQTTGSVAISFQLDRPGFQCPSNLDDLYSPGDGEIYLRSDQFQIQTASTLQAPLSRLYVVAQDLLVTNACPVVDETLFSANTFTNQAPIGSYQEVAGFLNYTPSEPHSYSMSFVTQDAAGIFSAPDSCACMVTPVETASIQGFLKKGCYIATAAFGSQESDPVVLLRRFRDEFLLTSSLGKDLVTAYYQVSPLLASVVQESFFLKLLTLELLLPIEIFAWLLLSQVYFVLLFLLVSSVLVLKLKRSRE